MYDLPGIVDVVGFGLILVTFDSISFGSIFGEFNLIG